MYNVHHDPVQGRGMSEVKCGEGRGEIGVRERKEGGREGGEWEGKKKEREEKRGRYRRYNSTSCIDVCITCM